MLERGTMESSKTIKVVSIFSFSVLLHHELADLMCTINPWRKNRILEMKNSIVSSKTGGDI